MSFLNYNFQINGVGISKIFMDISNWQIRTILFGSISSLFLNSEQDNSKWPCRLIHSPNTLLFTFPLRSSCWNLWGGRDKENMKKVGTYMNEIWVLCRHGIHTSMRLNWIWPSLCTTSWLTICQPNTPSSSLHGFLHEQLNGHRFI